MAKRKYASKGMRPNSSGGSFIMEDYSQPALLPRGVREMSVSDNRYGKPSGQIQDLYEQVERTTREDKMAFDKLTDPKSW